MDGEKRENNRWAVVTGASGGIGHALCRQFAQEGFNVMLISRDSARLSEVARELEARHHVKTLVLAMDLSAPSAALEIYRNVKDRIGDIDILINNAGFGDLTLFIQADLEVQRQMMQVNTMTLVELVRLFLPDMVERGSGRILNIASTAAFQPVPYMAVYGATKAFVLSFSEALSAELAGTGVTATALCPGVTATGFARRAGTEKTLLVRLNQMTAEKVARAGYRALMKGKTMAVPGWFNRILIGSLRFSPRGAVLKVTKRLMHP
jgi:short-subunit dehydrogenase